MTLEELKRTRQIDEIRILCVDHAIVTAHSDHTDTCFDKVWASIIRVSKTDNNQLIENFDVYNETGKRTIENALEIRKLFDEYGCNYLAIDEHGLGLGIIDSLMIELFDESTGIVYEALTCKNNAIIAKRCPTNNARPAIWTARFDKHFKESCLRVAKEILGKKEIIMMPRPERARKVQNIFKEIMDIDINVLRSCFDGCVDIVYTLEGNDIQSPIENGVALAEYCIRSIQKKMDEVLLLSQAL